MGFFDKLKASVGVGGASMKLDAPTVATSEAHFRIDVAVLAGKVDQKLIGVDCKLTLPRTTTCPDGTSHTEDVELWSQRIDTTGKNVLRPGDEHRFEAVVEAPACQALFEDADDYLPLVMSDAEELLWNADGPLPFAELALPQLTLDVGADITGAIDPHASRALFVLPEAHRPALDQPPVRLRPTAPMSRADLTARLARAYQVYAYQGADQWFIWWSLGGRVVAFADLKAIASVRPEGVVRTYTNPKVPKQSVLAKLDGESADRRDGELDEAFAWADELARQAKQSVLPRPIGNAVFGLDRLHLAEGF